MSDHRSQHRLLRILHCLPCVQQRGLRVSAMACLPFSLLTDDQEQMGFATIDARRIPEVLESRLLPRDAMASVLQEGGQGSRHRGRHEHHWRLQNHLGYLQTQACVPYPPSFPLPFSSLTPP